MGPDAQFLIAPMPRFEHWVKFLKRGLLKKDQQSPNESND